MTVPSAESVNSAPAPGYYPDPSIPGFIRFWDGTAWVPGTSRRAPLEGDPLPASPSSSLSVAAERPLVPRQSADDEAEAAAATDPAPEVGEPDPAPEPDPDPDPEPAAVAARPAAPDPLPDPVPEQRDHTLQLTPPRLPAAPAALAAPAAPPQPRRPRAATPHRLAPRRRRAAARGIDLVVVWGLTAAVAALTTGPAAARLALAFPVYLLAGLLWEAVPTGRHGRTLGKRLLGLRVLDVQNRRPAGVGPAVRRWSVHALLVPAVLDALRAARDTHHRCLHDRAAHTVVVDVRADVAPRHPGGAARQARPARTSPR